jgi:hypothetical protein
MLRLYQFSPVASDTALGRSAVIMSGDPGDPSGCLSCLDVSPGLFPDRLLVLWLRDAADVDDELVPVCREGGDRHTYRYLALVKASAENLKNRGIMRDSEKRLLVGIRRACRNTVAVTNLLYSHGFFEVAHYATRHILRYQQP